MKLRLLTIILASVLAMSACSSAPEEETSTENQDTTSAASEWESQEAGAEEIKTSGEGVVIDNAFIFNHVNGEAHDTERLAYVLFEYETLKYVKYQVAYLSCTWRSPEVNYYSVAYVELNKKDGSVRTISFDQDGPEGHYNPGRFGDTSVVGANQVPNRELIEGFMDDNIRGKTQEEINGIEPMHGEADVYTGATVTPNNLARMIQGLFKYHNDKYGK